MRLTQWLLFISALFIWLYPLWGVLSPQSYLNELIESFPIAIGASDSQVRQSALILLIPNSLFAVGLVCLGLFMFRPQAYHLANKAAFCLILLPFIQTISDVFICKVLSQHTLPAPVVIEFSTQKVLMIVFGLSLWAMVKSQRQLLSNLR